MLQRIERTFVSIFGAVDSDATNPDAPFSLQRNTVTHEAEKALKEGKTTSEAILEFAETIEKYPQIPLKWTSNLGHRTATRDFTRIVSAFQEKIDIALEAEDDIDTIAANQIAQANQVFNELGIDPEIYANVEQILMPMPESITQDKALMTTIGNMFLVPRLRRIAAPPSELTPDINL